jgi:hypothetical protein
MTELAEFLEERRFSADYHSERVMWYAALRDNCQNVRECRPQGDKPAHASPTDTKRFHPSARDWDG